MIPRAEEQSLCGTAQLESDQNTCKKKKNMSATATIAKQQANEPNHTLFTVPKKIHLPQQKMPSCILFCFVQTCSCFSRSFKGNIYLELSRFAQDDRNLVEHQLWTHSSLTQYHSSLLLRVSKLRNSFFQVTWSHRNSCAKNDYLVNIGVAIHQYSLQLSCVL